MEWEYSLSKQVLVAKCSDLKDSLTYLVGKYEQETSTLAQIDSSVLLYSDGPLAELLTELESALREGSTARKNRASWSSDEAIVTVLVTMLQVPLHLIAASSSADDLFSKSESVYARKAGNTEATAAILDDEGVEVPREFLAVALQILELCTKSGNLASDQEDSAATITAEAHGKDCASWRIRKRDKAPIDAITSLGQFVKVMKSKMLTTKKLRALALNRLRGAQEYTEQDKSNLFRYAIRMLQ